MMPSTDDQPLAYPLSSDSITLTPEQVAWALRLSQAAPDLDEQWQCYLNGLALLGFQTWLQTRSPELPLQSPWLPQSPADMHRLIPDPDRASPLPERTAAGPSLPSPARPPLSQQVSQIRVGATKLYLIPIGYIEDPWVSLPAAVPASWSPDLYVLVEVLEEISEVRIVAYLPQAEVHGSAEPLTALDAATSTIDRDCPQPELLIPTHQFAANPDRLLFQLRCAELVHQKMPVAEPVAAPQPAPLHATAINLGQWFQHQVDRLTEELSWILLPPLDWTGALMSSQTGGLLEDLEDVLQALRYEKNITVPATARSGYRDLKLESVAMRLYVVTWRLPDGHWSLLVVLGAQPGHCLPPGVKLSLSDQSESLIDLTLDQDPYLYAQVIGQSQDQFQLSIALPNGAALTLPPLIMEAEER